MTDFHIYIEGNSHLNDHFREHHDHYAPLIQEEATRVANETLARGGGVIEYEPSRNLFDHQIQKHLNKSDKGSLLERFSEIVENKAFDLLTNRNYWW